MSRPCKETSVKHEQIANDARKLGGGVSYDVSLRTLQSQSAAEVLLGTPGKGRGISEERLTTAESGLSSQVRTPQTTPPQSRVGSPSHRLGLSSSGFHIPEMSLSGDPACDGSISPFLPQASFIDKPSTGSDRPPLPRGGKSTYTVPKSQVPLSRIRRSETLSGIPHDDDVPVIQKVETKSSVPRLTRCASDDCSRQTLASSDISSEASSLKEDYDVTFGDLKFKLNKKLSAKCHCQFDVWQAESIQDGVKFALKLLNLEDGEPSKLKYKTHSITAEGRQLDNLCTQLAVLQKEADLAADLQENGVGFEPPSAGAQLVSSRPKPIPDYMWTATGRMFSNNQRVLGVAMEQIKGRSLTHILQQLRTPNRASLGLLAMEMATKIVEAQRLLTEALPSPVINWDTKPGNIILELFRSPNSGRLRCKRAVIVDLGDALPGPTYDFPTKHIPGKTPGYIICTKGYCAPECAILVFLLASTPRCSAFRKIWYGQNADVEKMTEARRIRTTENWGEWLNEGYLERSTPPGGKGDEDSTVWKVKFSQASVVFSTGLVLAQLFGGPSVLQLVERNETRALDLLCEWGSSNINRYTSTPNFGPSDFLPTSGVFSTGSWRQRVLTLLEGCLAFVPNKRWTFSQVETHLKGMLHDYHRSYYESKNRV